jgi:succinate dehydrogenase hydrophobic anchor subunit
MSDEKKEDNNNLVLSYLALRKAVGFLGIALPVVLILGAILIGNCSGLQASISDYHNTAMRDVFVGILCAIALFLFAYSGYDKLDFWMAKAAGLLGFFVAIFPDDPDLTNPCTIQCMQNIPGWMSTVHFISAAVFLLILAYFSIFLFTKTGGKPITPEKKKRNLIYRICGYTIIACLVLLAIYFLMSLQDELGKYSPVLILEALALWAFGFSWVVKGEFILKDHS